MKTEKTNKRSLPVLLRLAQFFASWSRQLLWGALGLSVIYTLSIVPKMDNSALLPPGDLQSAEGQVIKIERVRNTENKRPLMACHYKFKLPQGDEYEGTSYTGKGSVPVLNSKVSIEYSLSAPAEFSRIVGMSRNQVGTMAAFVFIIPAIIFIILLCTFKRSLLSVKLLEWGYLSQGSLKHKEELNMKVNGSSVYAYTFAFKDSSGDEFSVLEKTHRQALFNEDAEQLLYMNEAPEKARLLKAIPGKAVFNENEEITSYSKMDACLSLFIPLAAVLGIVGTLFKLF